MFILLEVVLVTFVVLFLIQCGVIFYILFNEGKESNKINEMEYIPPIPSKNLKVIFAEPEDPKEKFDRSRNITEFLKKIK